MNIKHSVPLSEHTTMRIGGDAQQYVEIDTQEQIPEIIAYAKANNLKIQTIGDGSNIIFTDAGFSGLVIVNKISGVDIDTKSGLVRAGAGENWDALVRNTVSKGLTGIEAMVLIPGTVGATPINNVGAYGQEIKDTLVSITAYDTLTNTFVELSNQECGFSYRSSRFKNEDYGRFIICSITLQLQPYDPISYTAPNYASLTKYLESNNIVNPQPVKVMLAVATLRSEKLPDPKLLANTGSFFKNPIVDSLRAKNLVEEYPEMPQYSMPNGDVKIAAGWLIENVGLKGYEQNGMRVYDKQALVIVNDAAHSYSDLANLCDVITSAVYEKFSIKLEPEPEIINP